MLDAGSAALVGNRHPGRPIQNAGRVEGAVDLLAFEQPVGVDAGPRRVEVTPDQRVVGRNAMADLLFVIPGDLGNDVVVDLVIVALKLAGFDDVKVGDIIEAYENIEISRTLESVRDKDNIVKAAD